MLSFLARNSNASSSTKIIRFGALLAVLLAPCTLKAEEAGFLSTLQGQWKGGGTILRGISGSPTNVSCTFSISAKKASLSMDGKCRGMLFINRTISANLKARGPHYTGDYIGPAGGRSLLSGSRTDNRINLKIRWATEVSGDRFATMTIVRHGPNDLHLLTRDRDLKTGRTVVTSNITLSR